MTDFTGHKNCDTEDIPAPLPKPLFKPLSEETFLKSTLVFFDLETTSLYKSCEIVQIGARIE